MAVSSEALPRPDKYRGGQSEPNIGLSMISRVEELGKELKELRGFAAPCSNSVNCLEPPEFPGTGLPTGVHMEIPMALTAHVRI